MNSDLIHDDGRLVGTRINVYNLLTDFLDSGKTEATIARLYDLTPEQVSAARSYILAHPEEVFSGHLKFEARNAAGNSPELNERLERGSAIFAAYRRWLTETPEGRAATEPSDPNKPGTYAEWAAQNGLWATSGT